MALQKFNQFIGIELLTSCFLENLGALFQSQGGECPFPRPRTPLVGGDGDIFLKNFGKMHKF